MASPADAQLVAAKILSALAVPFTLESNIAAVQIAASIGIALYPTHGVTAEELVSAADGAMYAAKQAGKGRFLFVDESGRPAG